MFLNTYVTRTMRIIHCVGNKEYIVNYEERDLEDIIQIDKDAFGTNREEFLKNIESCKVNSVSFKG